MARDNKFLTIDRPRRRAARALRDRAMTFMTEGLPGYDADKAHKAFKALNFEEGYKRHPLRLETAIAVTFAQNKRPRRAQQALYWLFQERMARGEAEGFFAFQDKLKGIEARGFTLENINFFKLLTDYDQDALWRDTGAAIDAVTKVMGPAFLNSGTLLGAVRDKSFIAHDDDVDIAVLLSANNAEEAAQEWVAGFQKLRAMGLTKKPSSRNLGVFKLKSECGINIDVFPAWIEQDRLRVYPHTFGELSTNDILPLVACDTTGLPIPRNAEAMLAVNYGEGWKHPDPGYTFNWGAANTRFAAFRAALQKHAADWNSEMEMNHAA